VISEKPSDVYGPIPIPAYDSFLSCCPYSLLMRADVAEAFVAHRWYDKSQLGMLYAAGLPVAVRDAVTALDQGISYGERDRLDAATKKK
jgi:hypothetical protein